MPLRRDHLSLLVLLAIIVVAGVVAVLLPTGIRAQREDQQCRLRLRRMGQALNAWVFDHGQRQFPAIRNPDPATPWQPGRLGSAESVLWEYLHGDVDQPRRDGETEADYHRRLREAQLSVCPVTGFAYWYHQDLLTVDPSAVAAGELPEARYFQCQRAADGGWPHRKQGESGVNAVFGHGRQAQITEADVAAMAERIDAMAAADPDRADLPLLRRTLERYRQAVAAGGGYAASVTLAEAVRFLPRE